MRPAAKKLLAAVAVTAMLTLSACTGGDDTGAASPTSDPTVAITDPTVGIAIDATGTAVAPTDDTIVVEVFSDFLCPWCEKFKAEQGDDLLQLAGDDRFDVRWRPVAWLDRNSGGTEYSTRTAMLLLYVAQQSPEHFWDTLTAITSVRETGPALSHQQLADVVTAVGVDGDLVGVQSDADLRSQALAFSNQASAEQVTHVPWINLDGEPWDWGDDSGSILDAALALVG